MTSEPAVPSCIVCGETATENVEPPRKTLTRGSDPSDPSYSVTVILPDVTLCAKHAHQVRHEGLAIGWCDDPRCRVYGELGQPSACGERYQKLSPSRS